MVTMIYVDCHKLLNSVLNFYERIFYNFKFYSRVRQYGGRHDVFDYFASYKDEDKKGTLNYAKKDQI